MCLGFSLCLFLSLSLAHFWLSVTLKEDLDDDKEVRCERFFLCFVTRTAFDMTFVAEREREGEESLFLSNARMRDENRLHFVFPSSRKMRNLVAKRTQTRTSF